VLDQAWVSTGFLKFIMNFGSYRRSRSLRPALCLLAAILLLVSNRCSAAISGADALVLVNSASPKYGDFAHYVQPYLETFGVPYSVFDIKTNAITTNIVHSALLIIGHRELDTNHLYLDATKQNILSATVSNGVGLVNFDSDLSVSGVGRYSFIQDIFGFGYTNSSSAGNVSFPPTQPGSQMHFITALHPTNDLLTLRGNISVPGLTLTTNGTAVALASGKPLVIAQKYGSGFAVQWANLDWMSAYVLGPIDGLDDAVSRGMIWAARKPFVTRSLPHFVTMRVDDVGGPFAWEHIANEVGFKPFLALFLSDVMTTGAIPDLRSLVTNGMASCSPHSITGSAFIYFDHQTEAPYSDTTVSNNLYSARQFHITNGIPMSKTIATHYSEIGANVFAGLLNWGAEYIPIEVVPGSIEYGTPPAPWLAGAPYRLFETPMAGKTNLPTYYADFLAVPGHPEFSNQFFNCYPEVRDAASCGEWCPDNNVATTIQKGTAILKRGLDSGTLPVLFTHDWYIQSIPSVTMNNPITAANFRAEMQGITNSLAAYKPIYVHLDYGNQYVRATKTSRMISSSYDSSSGQVEVVASGKSDFDLETQVFLGVDQNISNLVGTIPAFTNAITNTVITLPVSPSIITQPLSRTNHQGTMASFSVAAAGITPAYRWTKNGASINQATNPELALASVSTNDIGTYQAIVTNVYGAISSAPASLSVVGPLVIESISVTNGIALLNWSSIPGSAYSVQYQNSPASNDWESDLPTVTASSDIASMTNSLNGATQRFYRVFLNP
jgi:hypothetical protein